MLLKVHNHAVQADAAYFAKHTTNPAAMIPSGNEESVYLAKRSYDLPGIREIVHHPVTGRDHELKYVIMDLNDHYRWTREQIADWLETLDVDINFKETV